MRWRWFRLGRETWPSMKDPTKRIRRDPTYGQVDRDIQEHVATEYRGASFATRVAIADTMQGQRNRGQRGRMKEMGG